MRVIHNIKKLAKSEKGTALVLVLGLIMVLTALGAVAIMASTANIQMSGRYRNRMSEYYSLDASAVNSLANIDSMLSQAEDDTRTFMSNEAYSNTNSTGLGIELDSVSRSNLYSFWLNSVYNPCKYTIMHDDGSTENGFDANLYRTNLSKFIPSATNKLYMYYAYSLLNSSYTLTTTSNISISDYANHIFPDASTYASLDAWDNSGKPQAYDDNDLNNYYLKIVQNIATSAGKNISAKLLIQTPQYNIVPQTRNIPVKANPAWMNAIAAYNGIDFLSPATVNGDVFSSDKAESPSGIDGVSINEGNLNGIAVSCTNGTVNINGNVYSRGDVHITGNNATLNVDKYPAGLSVVYKDNLFNSLTSKATGSGNFKDLFIDANSILYNNSSTTLSTYEPFTHKANVSYPCVYEDVSGGNVYCNSLAVEAINDGHINLNNSGGILWTFDDIQMDGTQGSKIYVKNNYIGLRSEANSTGNGQLDYNASSSIINNSPEGSNPSTIELGGSIVVPGVAFYKLDNGIFETVESVSAKQDQTFQYYIDEATGNTYNYTTTTNGVPTTYQFKLTNKSFYEKLGLVQQNSIPTNIFVDSAVKGYSLGDIFLNNLPPYSPLGSNPGDLSSANYSLIKTALENIFRAKTTTLGTDGRAFKSLLNPGILNSDCCILINSDGTDSTFVPNGSDVTVNIGSNTSGIIYCYGKNLHITGSGAFNGTIICEGIDNGSSVTGGKILIEGNVTINYDENSIVSTIKNSTKAWHLFNPGEMGDNIFWFSQSGAAPGSGTRTNPKRIKIEEWKEN